MTENCKLRKAILSSFYNFSQRNFGILLILWCSFTLWWNFCLDLLSSKFWLMWDWSIQSARVKGKNSHFHAVAPLYRSAIFICMELQYTQNIFFNLICLTFVYFFTFLQCLCGSCYLLLASLSLSLSPVAFIVTVVETDQVEAGKQKPPDPGYLSTHRTIESTGLVVTSESYIQN
jgi:hypothetical protein